MSILFWAVDCQKDFIEANGKLYVHGAENIKPQLKRLTDFAKEHKITVVNTCDRHTVRDEEISETPDFVNTFPQHCMMLTSGAEFIEETDPYEAIFINFYSIMAVSALSRALHWINTFHNVVILKNKFDVFEGNPYTERIVKALNPDSIFVYGVAGDYCVDYAVKGLIKRNYKVTVVLDAIQSLKEAPIKEWSKLGVNTISTIELIKLLERKKDKVVVGDGKYTFTLVDGILYVDRYKDKNWRTFVGDGAVLALFQDLIEIKARLNQLKGKCNNET